MILVREVKELAGYPASLERGEGRDSMRAGDSEIIGAMNNH